MKILVTGGLGFIGSHLVSRLRFDGHVVDVIDIKNGLDCRKCLQLSHKVPDIIFHLASHNNAVESMTNVEKYVQNIEMTQGVIGFASRTNCKPKIIFTSSCAVYGQPLLNTVKETDIPMPLNVYGFTKLTSEALLQKYGSYMILRLANVTGKGSGIFAEQLRKMKTVCLYTFDDGKTLSRDYIPVEDVVHALIKSMKLQNEIVNVGSGKAISYLDLIGKRSFETKQCPPYIPRTISLDVTKYQRLFT